MKNNIDVKSNIHFEKLCFDNANFFYYTERVGKRTVMGCFYSLFLRKGGECLLFDRILRFFIVLIMAIVGGTLFELAIPTVSGYFSASFWHVELGVLGLSPAGLCCILFGTFVGGMIGYPLAPFFTGRLRRFSVWVEGQLGKMPTRDVIAGAIGLFIGLIIARLLGDAFSMIPIVGDYIPIVFSIVLGYLGVHIMVRKQEELAGVFDFIPRFLRDMSRAREGRAPVQSSVQPAQGDRQYKLLDTSVIIDGRIADICETGFLEGTLLIPVFVLEELQHIADSPDSLKRVRGRRGLDILQKIRKESRMKVEVTETDFEDIAEVDSKLLQLAQEVGGKIITNDFNLNKVAELRDVPVLNINELSNAVKPVVIPGETMRVSVVKEGKEPGQGVAYLDDGTMIVIENGRRHINNTIEVEVTSALQTAAGRMIFAKPRHG